MTATRTPTFAIVDIETNGGSPTGDNITEVAAILHDGRRELDRWVRLIRPARPIPSGITRLTGIDDTMVADAPEFGELATDLHTFLGDAVFVAHNVSFDLRHLQAGFKSAGLHYNPRRLCTVRMSRKWLEGPHRYSLGALCEFLGIDNEAHHRAWGDATATAELFSILWRDPPRTWKLNPVAGEAPPGGPLTCPDALRTFPPHGRHRFLDGDKLVRGHEQESRFSGAPTLKWKRQRGAMSPCAVWSTKSPGRKRGQNAWPPCSRMSSFDGSTLH